HAFVAQASGRDHGVQADQATVLQAAVAEGAQLAHARDQAHTGLFDLHHRGAPVRLRRSVQDIAHDAVEGAELDSALDQARLHLRPHQADARGGDGPAAAPGPAQGVINLDPLDHQVGVVGGAGADPAHQAVEVEAFELD